MFSLVLNSVHFLDDCVFRLHKVNLFRTLYDPKEGFKQLGVLRCVSVFVLAY